MKVKISRQLALIILIGAVIISVLNYFIQTENAQKNMAKKSLIKLNQIEKILENNSQEIEKIQEDLKTDYIVRAETAAYMIQRHKEYAYDPEELQKIADLLQVDELHLFDQEGVLVSGTVPEYFGLTMDDGEQIRFFKAMLEDTSLKLAQEVTPNTAEEKMMQYVAVWQEDEERIIQIGIQPERLLEAMEKNEMSYIFSNVTSEADTVIYAIDKESGLISGCTITEMIGQTAKSIGLKIPEHVTSEQGFSAEIQGENHYCIFEELGDQYIGISQAKTKMYENVRRSVRLLSIYLTVISVVMLIAMLVQLDKLIIQGIRKLNKSMDEIACGNLDVVVGERSTKEFVELSDNINLMVTSILDSTNTLSQLFDNADVEMGIYEYYSHMKRVLVTKKVAELLNLSDSVKREALADKDKFEAILQEIRKNPVEDGKDIFMIPGEHVRYVRIQSFEKEGITHGVIVDETDDILEKQRIEYERDSDMLTGLYSRRAFFNRAKQLFNNPEILKNAVILMADIDDLKTANDTYGHGFGDRLIAAAADLFKHNEVPNTLAVRLSGDEFALFIYGAENKQILENEIQRIYQNMMQKTILTPDGKEYPVRFSAGYVFYPKQVQTFSEMMHYADNTMYRVKRKNKANFMEYENYLL